MPPSERANIGLDCPYCGKLVEWYDLRIRMIFDEEMIRHRGPEFYELSCGHELPPGVEIHDAFLDDGLRETWCYSPMDDKTLLAWCDKDDIEDAWDDVM